MKIELWMMGKTAEKYLDEGISMYAKRLKHYAPFEMHVFADVKNAKSLNQTQLKEAEGSFFLEKIQAQDFVVLLDENGLSLRSVAFAKQLDKWRMNGSRRVVFVIGGAFGFSEALYQRANAQLALSPMTFSHQLVRLIFLEQLYRAMTILKGEPYHHE